MGTFLCHFTVHIVWTGDAILERWNTQTMQGIAGPLSPLTVLQVSGGEEEEHGQQQGLPCPAVRVWDLARLLSGFHGAGVWLSSDCVVNSSRDTASPRRASASQLGLRNTLSILQGILSIHLEVISTSHLIINIKMYLQKTTMYY